MQKQPPTPLDGAMNVGLDTLFHVFSMVTGRLMHFSLRVPSSPASCSPQCFFCEIGLVYLPALGPGHASFRWNMLFLGLLVTRIRLSDRLSSHACVPCRFRGSMRSIILVEVTPTFVQKLRRRRFHCPTI